MEAFTAGDISLSRTFISPLSLRLTGKGFCQQGVERYPSLHITCHAYPNERNVSRQSFEYSQETEVPSFFERLVDAWQVLFPPKPKAVSNAEIAKQRLKMILISDRCAISEDAKRKIVHNVVGVLSSFVEIESEESVELNVSADADLGTLYSVIVPVRRVKPQYLEYNDVLQSMTYGDAFEKMRTLDVRLEYPDYVDQE